MMDTVFMLFYAIGSFFSGSLAEYLQSSKIVALGLLGSGICVLLLVSFIMTNFRYSSSSSTFYAIPLVLYYMMYASSIYYKIGPMVVPWPFAKYWRSC